MRKGFTFIEVIISMMLLSIAVITVGQIVAISIKNYDNAELRYKATVGAQNLYEEIRLRLINSSTLFGEDLYSALQITKDEFELEYNGQRLEYIVIIQGEYWATSEGLPQNDGQVTIESATTILNTIYTRTVVINVYEKETHSFLFRLADVIADV